MKRLLLSVVIASTLGLTACGGKSSNEHKNDAVPVVPQAHLAFDPAADTPVVPLPSDLLFNGSTDGTLQVPGKETGNFSDPAIALGALDGWSTTEPITIPVNFPKYDSLQNPITDLGLLASSVEQSGVARVFAVQKSGPLAFDPNCKTEAAADALKVCRIEQELTYGVDFITKVVGNQIAIVPLKPLKQNQSYLYVITDKILDTYNRPISGSATFNVLKTDSVLPSADQRALQAAVHSYDDNLSSNGVDAKTITYASMFTTQSINSVIEATKAKMAADYQKGIITGNFGPYSPQLVPLDDSNSNIYVKQVMNEDGTPKTAVDVVQGVTNLIARSILSNALIYKARIKLPVFSSCSSVKCLDSNGNLTINGYWLAQGDSPLMVLSALSSGKLSQADFAAGLGDVDPTMAIANPRLLVGKRFYFGGDHNKPVDPQRLLTRYNPLPAAQLDENGNFVYETVDVQITIPKEVDNPLPDQNYVIPDTGYPISIGMHGIGTIKETNLAYSGVFAANLPPELEPILKQLGINIKDKSPVATITIDQPLHGERSFIKPDNTSGVYDVTATEAYVTPSFGLDPVKFGKGTVLNFVRINSPLTITGNFKQATIDELALRLVLPELSKRLIATKLEWATKFQGQKLQTGVFDTNKITVTGLSLGAMISTGFTAAANSGLMDASGQPVTSNPYKIEGVSLIAPAGGLAGSFAGSKSFGPDLFKAISLDPTFKAQLDAAAKAKGINETDNHQAYDDLRKQVYQKFIPPFGFAVQTAIDSIDPINYAPIIRGLNNAKNTEKHVRVHLIEFVGDGSDEFKEDQTLPNKFTGLPISKNEVLALSAYPLAGTDPLIKSLDLLCAAPIPGTAVVGSGFVRYTKGKHTSLIDPSDLNGQDNAVYANVTTDIQAQAAIFAATAASEKPEIEASYEGLIKTCN